MKPVMIDFASSGSVWRRDLRLPGMRLGLLMLALATMLGGAALQRVLRLDAELATARSAHAALIATNDRAAVANRARLQLAGPDALLLRQAALQRGVPWEAIFSAFEAVPEARLLAFEPDVANGVVKVQARIADLSALQGYLAGLQTSPVFVSVNLLRHETAADGGIDFQYEAVLAAPYRLPQAGPAVTP